MNFDEATIIATQKTTHFDLLYIEKVLRLLDILDAIFTHPELKEKYVLKGGTALNLFYFQLPRLSVDIDLNYIGLDRETMIRERASHETFLCDLLERRGYVLKRVPSEHAGGKWRLGYRSFADIQQNIELDLNYMHRLPLLPVQMRSSFGMGGQQVTGVRILDLHELAAGKFCALIARCKPRDLFDAYQLLNFADLDHAVLRRCFVIYAAFNKVDFSTVTGMGTLKFDIQQFRQELLETLASGVVKETPEEYLKRLCDGCSSKMAAILPFSENEQKFLSLVNLRGEIDPDLLTDSEEWRSKILTHPMLQWKVFNVRKHYGLQLDVVRFFDKNKEA